MATARIRGGFAMKIASMESVLGVLEARIGAADPRKIIERGYALALDGKGVVVKGVSGFSRGDKVAVMFSDGRIDCTVDEITR